MRKYKLYDLNNMKFFAEADEWNIIKFLRKQMFSKNAGVFEFDEVRKNYYFKTII